MVGSEITHGCFYLHVPYVFTCVNGTISVFFLPLEVLTTTGCWKIPVSGWPCFGRSIDCAWKLSSSSTQSFHPSARQEVLVMVVCCTVVWIPGREILRYLCCAHLLWI